MAKTDNSRGKDAAEIEPKFVPDDQLLPRDNSGGIDYEPRTAQFGGGGDIVGEKSYLSASSGTSAKDEMSERKMGERGYRKPAA